MFIPLSIMSPDMDWYNWNEKFMQRILEIVNSEKVKYRKSSGRVWIKAAKSYNLHSNNIDEIHTENEQFVTTPNKFCPTKSRSGLSEGRTK